MDLPGFDIGRLITSTVRTSLHHARRRDNGESVIVKVSTTSVPDNRLEEQLRREYEITHGLQVDGILSAIEIVRHKTTCAIVFPGCDCEPITERLGEAKTLIDDLLGYAIPLSRTLSEIHACGILHLDLKPTNILVERHSGTPLLVNFELAVRFDPAKPPATEPPSEPCGTYAYMAPEATGRVPRPVDHRTDIYSFGMTLFELVTGRRPFSAETAVQLMHSQIAKVAPSPASIFPEIPAPLNDIIITCINKAPEERYQGAAGLAADLSSCRDLLLRNELDRFQLRSHDVPIRLELTGRKYGREDELAVAKDAFERAATGRAEVLLISGTSGRGKTVLAEQLRKHVVDCAGTAFYGKFDPVKRDVPFLAVSEAFSAFAKNLLASSPEDVERWKTTLINELGSNAQVLVSLVPDLKPLLGEASDIEGATPIEALNRLNYSFRRLVHLLAKRESPLALVLDDLQWADGPTLRLVETMIKEGAAKHLLIVGLYRDDEVPPEHPFNKMVSALREASVPITEIALGPMQQQHVRELIEDTLKLGGDVASDLAKVLTANAAGNPFFMIQLLRAFVRDRLLVFDSSTLSWQCNLDAIRLAPAADNVVALVLGRMHQLPKEVQSVLNVAAHIGKHFTAETLSLISNTAQLDVDVALQELVDERFMVRREQSFSFAHDRYQQAAKNLTDKTEGARICLAIARRLRDGPTSEDLFDQARLFNESLSLIEDEAERHQVGWINIAAGLAARNSSAFSAAGTYLRAGISILETATETDYSIQERYEHLVALAECDYVSDRVAEADEVIDKALDLATTPFETGRALYMRINGYVQAGRYLELLEIAKKALQCLEVPFSVNASFLHVLYYLARSKLVFKKLSLDELATLPAADDPTEELIQRLFGPIAEAAYNTGNQNLIAAAMLYASCRFVEKGACAASVTIFSAGGMVQSALGNYERGHMYGELALRLAERFNSDYYRSVAHFARSLFNGVWMVPVSELSEGFEKAVQTGIASGNLIYAGYAASLFGVNTLYEGVSLERAAEVAQLGIEMTVGRDPDRLPNAMNTRELVRALRSDDLDPTYDQSFFDDAFFQSENPLHPCRYYIGQMIIRYLRGEYAIAFEMGNRASSLGNSIVRMLEEEVVCFYHGLSAIACARSEVSRTSRFRYLLVARRSLRQMRKWAKLCPANRAHKVLLLQTELSTLRGAVGGMSASYDEAKRLAVENGFVNDAALICLCAGRHFAAKGETRLQDAFFLEGVSFAEKWGAKGIVAVLDRSRTDGLGRSLSPRGQAKSLRSTAASASVTQADFDALIRSNLKISGAIRLSEIVAQSMQFTLQHSGADKGVLVLVDGQALTVEARIENESVTVFEEPVELEQIGDRLPCAAIYYVRRTRRTLVLPNAAESVDFASDPYIKSVRLKALLCVPVLARGELLGIVCLENNLLSNAFVADRVQLVQILASQAAVSIENSRLYRNLEQKVAERTGALKEAQDRLLQFEREATEVKMAGGFAHEMRNALATARNITDNICKVRDSSNMTFCERQYAAVTAILERLEAGVGQENGKNIALHLHKLCADLYDLEEQLQEVDASTDRAMGVTRQILDYSRLDHVVRSRDACDLTRVVMECVDERRNELRQDQIGIAFGSDNECLVEADEDHLRSIVSNLIINAHHALVEVSGRARMLKVDVKSDDLHVTLSVADNGTGIPPAMQDLIFDPFFTTKGAKGTGLGMSIVRRLALLYGGTVQFDSEMDAGTEFRVRLWRSDASGLPRSLSAGGER